VGFFKRYSTEHVSGT